MDRSEDKAIVLRVFPEDRAKSIRTQSLRPTTSLLPLHLPVSFSPPPPAIVTPLIPSITYPSTVHHV